MRATSSSNNGEGVSEQRWPPFSGDLLLDTIRDIYLPGARKAIVTCEGYTVRTLLQSRGRALGSFYRFPLYLEPVAPGEPGTPVGFLSDVVTGSVIASVDGAPGHAVAPFVDWTQVESWDSYLAERRSLPGVDSLAAVLRKRARLERDLGPLTLNLVDTHPGLLDTLMQLKSAQYRRNGVRDNFAIRENVECYERLHRLGVLVATGLWAGDHLLGGLIGMRTQGRHLSRLTVYDRRFAKYSPGSVLALETLRAGYEAGDTEFDFLGGREPYKFSWATHMRVLTDLGTEPRLERTLRMVRRAAGGRVQRSGLYPAYRGLISRGRKLAGHARGQ